MHAPKSIKQSLAIDFFLFCIDLTTLNLFSRKKNLKRGKRRKIRIEFVNPNSAFFLFFMKKKIHLSLSHHSLKSLSLAE
jgi:hypothetical protein